MPSRRPGPNKAMSSSLIDRLRESELQSSIFRPAEGEGAPVDFQRLRAVLEKERHIPDQIAERVLHHIQDNLTHLGLSQPSPSLVLHWLNSLLREEGYSLDEASLQSLELSLGDVELNIFHPVGLGAGATQNPEATSLKIAQRIKAQFAVKRVFQEDVATAHEEGEIELMHLGAIDRPHDVFLTPDYLKIAGLPVTSSAPAAGPTRRAPVLLAHMIRFTHELQNHFAGDIHWGYVNTLLLPYLDELSEAELYQFIQQMLFEFAQLDVERGSLYRKVILDFDFDIPRQLAGLPAMREAGKTENRTYSDYRKRLRLFNEIVFDILDRGDFRGNPFHAPRIVYHFNNPDTTWDDRHQRLMAVSFKWGNPCIAFSYYSRDFGALGRISLNDPDFLKRIQTPFRLRGFSSSSLAINLPNMGFPLEQDVFNQRLERVLDLAVAAHRQRRLLISRLMAFGNRGPLQFLRHKIDGRPFLKIDQATQPMYLLGLGEAAALRNHAPGTRPNVLGQIAETMLQQIQTAMETRNRPHKLKMFLAGTQSESVAYRFAFLDLKRHGQSFAPYVFHRTDQAHPIYTDGPNILSFTPLHWRERLQIEARLHPYFSGHALTLFLKNGRFEDPSIFHKIYQAALAGGVTRIQPAPDLWMCLSCFFVFQEEEATEICPTCSSTLISPYGFCQTGFSPVHTWCMGKRSEWKIRRRIDDRELPVQHHLPW